MSETPGAVGTWILSLVTPIGELAPEVVFNADGTAVITFDLGTIDVFDVVYGDDDLRFTAKVQMPMGEFELTFAGTVAGDDLAGSVFGSLGTFPVAGVRQS